MEKDIKNIIEANDNSCDYEILEKYFFLIDKTKPDLKKYSDASVAILIAINGIKPNTVVDSVPTVYIIEEVYIIFDYIFHNCNSKRHTGVYSGAVYYKYALIDKLKKEFDILLEKMNNTDSIEEMEKFYKIKKADQYSLKYLRDYWKYPNLLKSRAINLIIDFQAFLRIAEEYKAGVLFYGI